MKICNIVLIIFLIVFNSPLSTSNITNKLPNEFSIKVTGYYKLKKTNNGSFSERQFIKLKNEVEVIEFKNNKITINEIQVFDNDKEFYMLPVLDDKGQPKQLKFSKDYDSYAKRTIHGLLELKIYGNTPDNVYLCFTKYEKGYVGVARLFNKADPTSITLFSIKQEDINNKLFDKNLALIYSDSDLNYQVKKIDNNGKFNTTYQNSINPDIDDIDKHVGIEDLVDYAYFLNNEKGKGYLSLSPNNKQFISNGKKSELGYKPQLINNKLFVHAQWFVSQVYGSMDYDSSKKAYIIKRLYKKIGAPSEFLEIELVRDDDIITLNGTKYKLSAKPIFDAAYTMMPLRDLCELLKVRLIYQPITNTYLIQRFNTAYDPPFNLQKVE